MADPRSADSSRSLLTSTEARVIFEAAEDGLVINDPDTGYVLEANPAFCRMHGYGPGEMRGLYPSVFIAPEDMPLFGAFIEQARGGSGFRTRATDVRRDGTRFPVAVTGSPLPLGGRVLLLGVVRDITAEVQAEHIAERLVAERTRELSTLLNVSRSVASTLDFKQLAEVVLTELRKVTDYDGAAITVLQEGALLVVDARVSADGDPRLERMIGMRFPVALIPAVWQRLCAGEPVTLHDVSAEEPLATEYRALVGPAMDTVFAGVKSLVAVPLNVRGATAGALLISARTTYRFSPHHAEILLAFAAQAAVALGNAQLHEQARLLAVVEERQRLARELHDSVSQALYGIALGSKTARTVLDRDPVAAREPLEYVMGLAESALAEMRALLFELRPESLEREGLTVAVARMAEALGARTGIAVELTLCDEPEMALARKEALYRVAQEALNNVAKHAQASRLDVELTNVDETFRLRVRDNGLGFDPTASFPGHLGLHTMRERVAPFAGLLEITSAPGEGTTLVASVLMVTDASA